MQVRFAILRLSELRGHEMPERSRVEELKRDLSRRRILIKPVVVDRDTRVILDGHCRCDALKKLGCSKVAAVLVDYSSKDIHVRGWDGSAVTKEQVLEAGLSGRLMKPKTSRHAIRSRGKTVHISEICGDASIPIEKLE